VILSRAKKCFVFVLALVRVDWEPDPAPAAAAAADGTPFLCDVDLIATNVLHSEDSGPAEG